MATRMQQRRGTASQWTIADPVLAAGEIGVESDTAKFKIGDGINTWSTLDYFSATPDLTEYATETYVDTAILNIIDSAPGALDTLNELATALGDDANFATTITNSLAAKANAANMPSTSDAPPESPQIGQIWWNSDTASLFVYYDGFWIEAVNSVVGPEGPVGPTGPTGSTGPVGGFDTAQNIQELSSNYNIGSGDAGKLFTNSTALTVLVGNLSVGEQVDFIQTSSQQISFSAGPGVNLYSRRGWLKTEEQYSPASVKCISSNTYVLVGSLGN